METKMKFFYPTVKQINQEQRRITVCISRDELDRDEERIAIESITKSFKIYAENPVLYGDHQHRLSTGKSAVIGHGLPETFRIEKDQQSRDCVVIDYVFSTTENAETYWINYRDGHQKAVSIGFIPKEGKQEFARGKSNYVHTDIEWLETSCVGVGSNRGALVRSKGQFDCLSADEDLKDAIATAVKDVIVTSVKQFFDDHFNGLKQSFEQQFDDMRSIIIAERGELGEGLLGGPLNLPASGGEFKNAEQSLERIEKAFKETFDVDK